MDSYSYELGVVAGFSETINAGVKQLALSSPMLPTEMDDFLIDAEKIAAKHQVKVYREIDLIKTGLFPANIAKGKDVLLLYQGTTLDSYFTLKEEVQQCSDDGDFDSKKMIELSKRFGRMLSYSPEKINALLAKNTSYRTMSDFGIKANNLFLYYKDLKKAGDFYTKTLGLELIADYEKALILRISVDSYLTLVDEAMGMHSSNDPKTVALALLTEQLDEWYDYLVSKDVEIKYEYKPKQGSAHDGFVAVDPEGYLLEFERFNQHIENEKLIPVLKENIKLPSLTSKDSDVPSGLNFHSSITWLYYKDVLKMQHFFEDVLGLTLIADQGWTKIYSLTKTGFLAIVDEKRGMHKFTEDKAVNVGFILEDLDGWFEYVKNKEVFPTREEQVKTETLERYRAFIGYCPENYVLEFNEFLEHEINEKLNSYLSAHTP